MTNTLILSSLFFINNKTDAQNLILVDQNKILSTKVESLINLSNNNSSFIQKSANLAAVNSETLFTPILLGGVVLIGLLIMVLLKPTPNIGDDIIDSITANQKSSEAIVVQLGKSQEQVINTLEHLGNSLDRIESRILDAAIRLEQTAHTVPLNLNITQPSSSQNGFNIDAISSALDLINSGI